MVVEEDDGRHHILLDIYSINFVEARDVCGGMHDVFLVFCKKIIKKEQCLSVSTIRIL